MAKLLSGHTEGQPRLFRYNVDVAEGKFELDSVAGIEELSGYGSTIARTALPSIRDVFLDEVAEPFVPCH